MNTKVDMRFNVEAADWLPQKIREKLLQMVFLSNLYLSILLDICTTSLVVPYTNFADFFVDKLNDNASYCSLSFFPKA